MNALLTLLFFLCTAFSVQAQPKTVAHLPPGHYHVVSKESAGMWRHGDIILLNPDSYRTAADSAVGTYRISITAQRIFFTTGPLRGFFARLVLYKGQPAIELPQAQNSQQAGPAADVMAVWQQKHF